MRVLADTGMRVGELVKLRDSDSGVQDRQRHYLKVRGPSAFATHDASIPPV